MCKVTAAPIPPPYKAIAATKKTKRRIRFGRVHAKVYHQKLTKSDKKTMWYSGNDYKAMNKEVRHNLKCELYYGYDPNNTERSCWRGLEHIREGVPNIKLERRRCFVRSFLHAYKTMGVTDPDKLGAMISAESEVDRIRAQQFANYDAYEASCVYYEPEPHNTWDGYYCDYDTDEQQQQQHHQQQQKQQDQEIKADYYKEFSDIPRSTCVRPKQTIIVARAS